MVRTKTKAKAKKGSEGLAASKDKSRDILPRTSLGVGGEFVDGASKFLAAYGKFITPVVVVIIAAFAGYYFYTKSSAASEEELRTEIERAAQVDKLDELAGKMEPVIAKADDEETLQSFARYRHSMRAFELLERPYKTAELETVIKVMQAYMDHAGSDPEKDQHTAWTQRITNLKSALEADLAFLNNSDNKKLLPWDHHSKADKPQATVEEGVNPIVVFVTSVGKLRFELFESDAINAVKHFVSLCNEGFFDRTDFSSTSFSNSFAATGPFRNSTVVTAGREGRPVGVELEKPTTAKEEDDVDLVAEPNPYSIDYQGSSIHGFEVGSIALIRDEDDPMRARSAFFVVIEPSDALAQNFAPIGQLLDGEDGMRIARRLSSAEIYYTYVERKRKDTDYSPRVYYDGWPVATLKRDKVPEPVRYSKVKTRIVEKANPIIVIELEKGDIVIELFEDVAPNTVANFINLIEEGFYDQECEFYRVEGTGSDLADIYKQGGLRIIQGGFDQSQSRDGYDYGIKNEAHDNEEYRKHFNLDGGGIANGRGTIAMARTSDLHSASTEFFINIKDFPDWDGKDSPYCVFGEVISGMDLVATVAKDDAIKGAKVIRKRRDSYLPQVKYKSGGGYVDKKAVTIPKAEQ